MKPTGPVTIEQGDVTIHRKISVYLKFDKPVLSYLICENPEFRGCEWKPAPKDNRATFLLSPGSGTKHIYVMVRHENATSEVFRESIQYIDTSQSD